ncbi:MAG: protein-export chaperone SecB [Pseudomonadota bacterium]
MSQENTNVQINVLSQFTRDASFVNQAAKERRQPNGQPTINVTVNVDPSHLSETRYEVSLTIHATAVIEEKEIFSMFLDYVGIFDVLEAPKNMIGPMLAIECPRLLFPFARRMIADVTRDGGYPPLMLDPIDFAGLYRQRMQQLQASGGAPATEEA